MSYRRAVNCKMSVYLCASIRNWFRMNDTVRKHDIRKTKLFLWTLIVALLYELFLHELCIDVGPLNSSPEHFSDRKSIHNSKRYKHLKFAHSTHTQKHPDHIKITLRFPALWLVNFNPLHALNNLQLSDWLNSRRTTISSHTPSSGCGAGRRQAFSPTDKHGRRVGINCR